MTEEALVQATIWLVVVTAGLVLATMGLVVVGVLGWRASREAAAEAKAERRAIEAMAAATAEDADASRRAVEELRAQRAAADPLRLDVAAEMTAEGVRFIVSNPQGTHGERRTMVLTRWEIRGVVHRSADGDVIANSDADDAIAPAGKHFLSPVPLDENRDVAVFLSGRPLNGLDQTLEYRFRFKDAKWLRVEDYHYKGPAFVGFA